MAKAQTQGWGTSHAIVQPSRTQRACNGTGLIAEGLRDCTVQTRIVTGAAEYGGTRMPRPRISLSPNDAGLPAKFVQRQLPLRLAFAMAIKKS